MKLQKRGSVTSEPEVLNISKFGLWLLVQDHEYFLPFNEFPWFNKATVQDIHDVKLVGNKYLNWPKLDVDLSLESLGNLEKFPLKYKANE